MRYTHTQTQTTFLLFTLRAKLSGAVYCNRSCLWVCGGRCLWRTGGRAVSVTTITRNCVHRSPPNWIGAGSDHLQLIKFWRSCAPGKGSAAGRNLGPLITFERKERSTSNLVQTYMTEPPCDHKTTHKWAWPGSRDLIS